jgi:hypothetical protein
MYENVWFSQRICILFFRVIQDMGYSSDTSSGLISYQIINIGF